MYFLYIPVQPQHTAFHWDLFTKTMWQLGPRCSKESLNNAEKINDII